jgi:hypothetical protein
MTSKISWQRLGWRVVASVNNTARMSDAKAQPQEHWLGPGVAGIGTASFLADVGHEIPTALLPSLLTATLGAPAAALGLIEGLADGLEGEQLGVPRKRLEGCQHVSYSHVLSVAVAAHSVSDPTFCLPWHPILCRMRFDHPDDHPDDPSVSVWSRLDRRRIQHEQARSVWSRPGRRRTSDS